MMKNYVDDMTELLNESDCDSGMFEFMGIIWGYLWHILGLSFAYLGHNLGIS